MAGVFRHELISTIISHSSAGFYAPDRLAAQTAAQLALSSQSSVCENSPWRTVEGTLIVSEKGWVWWFCKLPARLFIVIEVGARRKQQNPHREKN